MVKFNDSKIIRMQTNNGPMEGEEVQFTPESEPWSVYRVDEGYAVKLKFVVQRIAKTAQKDADGNPIYLATVYSKLAVVPPDLTERIH